MKSTAAMLLLSALSTALAQAPGADPTNLTGWASYPRHPWVLQTLNMLKAFEPGSDSPLSEVGEHTYSLRGSKRQCTSYGIRGNLGEAYIPFSSNDWVYIRVHSHHRHDRLTDLSLAIDARGNVYKNFGHVCGGIRFANTNEYSDVMKAFGFPDSVSSETFFREFKDTLTWREWRPYADMSIETQQVHEASTDSDRQVEVDLDE